MNQSKEKSAVGAATPATVTTKAIKNIIASGDKYVKCVIKEVGEISQPYSMLNNVDVIRAIVDGQPATLVFNTGINKKDDYLIIYNNYGIDSLGNTLDTNITVNGMKIAGTIIVVRNSKKDYSLTTEQIQDVRGWLLKNEFWEKKT